MNPSKGPHDMPGMPGAAWMPGMPGNPPDDFQLPPADVSHIRRKWLDVTYAPASATQRLDIYLPDEGEGPFPVLFYTHGGAFRIGDKCDLNALPYPRALEHGYALVSVNYRLSGEAIFPAGLQDAKANPMTYVHEGMAPMLIQHGTADCQVPYQQSVEFARVIEERVGPDRYELDLLEGAGHGDPAFEIEENLNRVFAFVDRHLK